MSELQLIRRQVLPRRGQGFAARLTEIRQDSDGVYAVICGCGVTMPRFTTDAQVAQDWRDHHRCTGIGYSNFGGLPQ